MLRMESGGPWTLTMEAWRLKMEPWSSLDHWSKIRITLMGSKIRIGIKVKVVSGSATQAKSWIRDADPQPSIYLRTGTVLLFL
jgi:hypothetical protein